YGLDSCIDLGPGMEWGPLVGAALGAFGAFSCLAGVLLRACCARFCLCPLNCTWDIRRGGLGYLLEILAFSDFLLQIECFLHKVANLLGECSQKRLNVVIFCYFP